MIVATLTATLAAGVLLAAPSQAADFGALTKCSDAGESASLLQVSTTCDQGRKALALLASKGAKAAVASGINCHWIAGDAQRVICTWDKKVRGGGSGGSLYADLYEAAQSAPPTK